MGLARTFWIQFSVSTTIPYVVLALLFLAHCDLLRSRSRWSAYLGAVAAWLAMMGFSAYLILHALTTPAKIGPTGATLAVALTPFFYVPFLFVPYAVGAIVGAFWNKGNV